MHMANSLRNVQYLRQGVYVYTLGLFDRLVGVILLFILLSLVNIMIIVALLLSITNLHSKI